MPTTVGLVHLWLRISQAGSLKDKRRIVKSFKDRLADRYKVSVAEVDGQNRRQYAVLAVALVGHDKRHLQGALQRVINAAEKHRDMVLADYEIEWL